MLMGLEDNMTNRKYVHLTRCSDAPANRDLGDLIARHFLQTDKTGGRGSSYSLEKTT